VNFWSRLDKIAEQNDVLRHPFYVRWSEGTLTSGELAHYSGQYRHAVLALAAAASSAAGRGDAGRDGAALAAHAREEAEHVALWDEFVSQVGGDVDAEPTAETRACVEVWAGEETRPMLHTLTAMYAIESTQPAISNTKQIGLSEYYGIDGSAYFELHRRLDVEHARELRELIDKRLDDADLDALLDTAGRVLKANWLLLDGVDAARAG
jgi:pyrroloquinoline-quinone synthase